MLKRSRWFSLAAGGLSLFWAPSLVHGTNLTVVSFSPTSNATSAPVNSAIVVNFDRPVLISSFTPQRFWAFGRCSGRASGALGFSNSNQTVTLAPTAPFAPGESVMVLLSHDLIAADGSPLRPAGYSFKFWARTRHGCTNYVQIDSMSNRLFPREQTRIYGSLAVDLNHDHFADLATINEDSADIRVFLNKADGTGLYNPWLQPPTPTLPETSPHQPADFNGDGHTDICLASFANDKVTVVLGNGDGTFQPQQMTNVGNEPAGICVLDVDGDGDLDIVNTNHAGNNMSRLLNNGSGVFGAPTFFEGGGNGEYAVAASDMNNDGIMDLVIGTFDGQQVIVQLGNGNGTFTALPAKPSGGNVWQIGTGDMNGDGREDVQVANSFANNGAILFNNAGTGVLGPPQMYESGSDPVATDVGDVDGDGDLDWILSSFSSADWHLFINDGTGVLSFDQSFDAPQAGSCASFLDFDNDGDLDIALADELADVVLLHKNSGIAADINCDGHVNVDDLLAVINGWGPCPLSVGCAADIAPAGITGDATVNVDDLLMVINNWG